MHASLLLHCSHFYAHIQSRPSVHPYIHSSPARSVRLSVVLSAVTLLLHCLYFYAPNQSPPTRSFTASLPPPQSTDSAATALLSARRAASRGGRARSEARDGLGDACHLYVRGLVRRRHVCEMRRLIAIENHGEIFCFQSQCVFKNHATNCFCRVGCQQYFYLVPCLKATLCLRPLFSHLPPSVIRSSIGIICVCRRVCIPTAAGRLLIGSWVEQGGSSRVAKYNTNSICLVTRSKE